MLRPPRLGTTLEEEESSDLRHATWMELFYDLVFVVAVAALGSRLSHDCSPVFVVLVVIDLWLWETGSGRPDPACGKRSHRARRFDHLSTSLFIGTSSGIHRRFIAGCFS